jgi:hypothetical protein
MRAWNFCYQTLQLQLYPDERIGTSLLILTKGLKVSMVMYNCQFLEGEDDACERDN